MVVVVVVGVVVVVVVVVFLSHWQCVCGVVVGLL